MHAFLPLVLAAFVLLFNSAAGQSSLEAVQDLEPQFLAEYGSKRVKIRHDPHLVPSNTMSDFGESSVQLPCRDCLITWIQAGLEYSNGTIANASNGIWLHHMVLFTNNRESKVCPEVNIDKFFASGEERTPASICADGKEKAGYYISPTDTMGMTMEVMNLNQDLPINISLTLTYEYIPNVPDKFSKVDAYWLDIGGCGTSFFPAYTDTAFNYTSPAIESNSTGHITFSGSHLHDGGTNLEIYKNNNLICNTTASYSTSHISQISSCTSTSLLDPSSNLITPFDIFTIKAYYDTTLHTPMASLKDPATLDTVMGISILYIAPSPPHSPTEEELSSQPPSPTLILSCILIAIIALAILIFARMTTENKSFSDLCPCFPSFSPYRNIPPEMEDDEISLKENMGVSGFSSEDEEEEREEERSKIAGDSKQV